MHYQTSLHYIYMKNQDNYQKKKVLLYIINKQYYRNGQEDKDQKAICFIELAEWTSQLQ